jgi:hypothetical protein
MSSTRKFWLQLTALKASDGVVIYCRDGDHLVGRILEIGDDYVRLEVRGVGHVIRAEAIDRFAPVPVPAAAPAGRKAPTARSPKPRWLQRKRDLGGY